MEGASDRVMCDKERFFYFIFCEYRKSGESVLLAYETGATTAASLKLGLQEASDVS
jgi:hypothetical protein